MFSGKILVTTGTGGGLPPGMNSEVIDVLNEKVICEDLSKAPWGVGRATGGLINGTPLICSGGWNKGCFTVGKSQNIKFPNIMNHHRSPTTSLVVGDKVSPILVNIYLSKRCFSIFILNFKIQLFCSFGL